MFKKILVGVFLLVAAIGITLHYRSRPIEKINSKIPAGFLYTKVNDILPESSYLVPGNEEGQVDHPLILAELAGGKFYCKKIEDHYFIYEPTKIQYFSSASGLRYGMFSVVGDWSERFALVCADNYFIVSADSVGFKMYGPFKVASK